jgi:hypothetical protein
MEAFDSRPFEFVQIVGKFMDLCQDLLVINHVLESSRNGGVEPANYQWDVPLQLTDVGASFSLTCANEVPSVRRRQGTLPRIKIRRGVEWLQKPLALNTGRNGGRNISYHILRMRLTKVGIIAFDNGLINSNGRLSTRKRTIASISLKTDLMWWSVVPSPRERRF